jgi:hypothetical protein
MTDLLAGRLDRPQTFGLEQTLASVAGGEAAGGVTPEMVRNLVEYLPLSSWPVEVYDLRLALGDCSCSGPIDRLRWRRKQARVDDGKPIFEPGYIKSAGQRRNRLEVHSQGTYHERCLGFCHQAPPRATSRALARARR